MPYNALAINKEFIQIYNESWFRDKVNLVCFNHKKHNNSYEYLYRRLLKSGTVNIVNSAYRKFNLILPIKGIKASAIMKNSIRYLILTFDGNLYCYDSDTTELILIDFNVKDISESYHIKEYEWYKINHDQKSKLIMRSESSFLFVTCYAEEIAHGLRILYIAVTENTVHYIMNDKYHHLEVNFKIKNVVSGCDRLILQDTEGQLYHFNISFNTIEKMDYPKVKKICDNYLQLCNGDLIYRNFNSTIPHKIDNLQATATNLLLLDNNLYSASGRNIFQIDQNIKGLGRTSVFYNYDYIIKNN